MASVLLIIVSEMFCIVIVAFVSTVDFLDFMLLRSANILGKPFISHCFI